MTLYRQIVLVVVALSILMFAGTAIINVQDTRNYLATQLESHAQDTATSLGLSLSPQMANGDDATMISMVDAIFDRGYYKNITLRRIDGEVISSRQSDVTIEGVPAWVIETLKLEAPEATSIIMSGWQQGGEIYVKSHPGYAYKTLWQTITNMLWWFSGLTVVLLLLAGMAVRVLLQPLDRLEAQALSVSDRQFDEIKEIPRTRELRNLIKAMNYMTSKVKQMFEAQSESTERLRSLAFQDPLTGLQNRRYFHAALNSSLNEAEEHQEGALLLVQIIDLQAINQRLGFDTCDALLKVTAEILKQSVADINNIIVSRLSGGDFAIITPNMSEEAAETLGNEICRRLMHLHAEDMIDTDKVCLAGIAMFNTGMSYGDVLSRADNALQTARVQGINTCSLYAAPEKMTETMPGRQAWQAIVRDAVDSENIILHAQTVINASDKNKLLHKEILLRLAGPDDVLWTAGMFLPVAEQIGLAKALDQIVIKKVLTEVCQSRAAAEFAINISASAIHDADFPTWFDAMLKEAGKPTKDIVFEISESTVVHDIDSVHQLAEIARKHGYGFAVDHFGRGMTAFGYLKSLRPNYVKIDGLYMSDLVDSQDDQFFVSSLCKVAHSLDIVVIAEAVENDEQLNVLKQLGVDGVQGFGIGRPASL